MGGEAIVGLWMSLAVAAPRGQRNKGGRGIKGKDPKHFCPDLLKVEFKQELFSFPVVFNTTHSFVGTGFQGLFVLFAIVLPWPGITGTCDHTKHRLYSLAVISTYSGGQERPEMKHSFALTPLTGGSKHATWPFLPPWYSWRRTKYMVRFAPRWYRPRGKQFPRAQNLAEPGCRGPSAARAERPPAGPDPHTKRTGHWSCFRLHRPCGPRVAHAKAGALVERSARGELRGTGSALSLDYRTREETAGGRRPD